MDAATTNDQSTGEIMVKRLMPLVPALCSFGPLVMVIGYETPHHLMSLVCRARHICGNFDYVRERQQTQGQRDSVADPTDDGGIAFFYTAKAIKLTVRVTLATVN